MSDPTETLGIDETELVDADLVPVSDEPTEPEPGDPVLEEATADRFTDPGL